MWRFNFLRRITYIRCSALFNATFWKHFKISLDSPTGLKMFPPPLAQTGGNCLLPPWCGRPWLVQCIHRSWLTLQNTPLNPWMHGINPLFRHFFHLWHYGGVSRARFHGGKPPWCLKSIRCRRIWIALIEAQRLFQTVSCSRFERLVHKIEDMTTLSFATIINNCLYVL